MSDGFEGGVERTSEVRERGGVGRERARGREKRFRGRGREVSRSERSGLSLFFFDGLGRRSIDSNNKKLLVTCHAFSRSALHAPEEGHTLGAIVAGCLKKKGEEREEREKSRQVMDG